MEQTKKKKAQIVLGLKISMSCPIHEGLEEIENGLTMITERLKIALGVDTVTAVTKVINHKPLEQLTSFQRLTIGEPFLTIISSERELR